jgi:hypothetical protein
MIFEFRIGRLSAPGLGTNFDCLRGGLSPSHDFGRRATGSHHGESGYVPAKIAIAAASESKF